MKIVVKVVLVNYGLILLSGGLNNVQKDIYEKKEKYCYNRF